jgi:adenylate cyclase
MAGDEDRARDWIRRALLLDPDNLSMRYNVACTLVRRLGDAAEAIDALRPYLEAATGATQIAHAEADPDLDPIRDDPKFKEMLAAAKQRIGMAELT